MTKITTIIFNIKVTKTKNIKSQLIIVSEYYSNSLIPVSVFVKNMFCYETKTTKWAFGGFKI